MRSKINRFLAVFFTHHKINPYKIPFKQGHVFRHSILNGNRLNGGSLNPFRAGRCLSTNQITSIFILPGLNPFRTGRCLSTKGKYGYWIILNSLNPFRTGRCLSTRVAVEVVNPETVSIPFEQGDVFRQNPNPCSIY